MVIHTFKPLSSYEIYNIFSTVCLAIDVEGLQFFCRNSNAKTFFENHETLCVTVFSSFLLNMPFENGLLADKKHLISYFYFIFDHIPLEHEFKVSVAFQYNTFILCNNSRFWKPL